MSWRRLRTLMRREVQATFRDPFTMIILVAVPLAALLVFGFVLSTEVKHLPLGVLDASKTPASRRLIAEITASGSFRAHAYATREDLDRALVSGAINVGIAIPPEFGRKLEPGAYAEASQAQVIYDGGEAVLAGNAEAFLRSLIVAAAPALLPRGSLADDAGAPVSVISRALFNPRLDGKPFMVSGTFGFVLSFLTVLLAAVSIVNERITGTFEQLQVTPATSLEILLGKLLPMGAVFAFDVVLMVFVAGFVLDVWPAGSIFFFIAVSSFYVLVSLALGIIISATSATAAEAVQKTVMLSIPLVQLSGFAFPIRSMPEAARWIAEIFPATHYIRLSRAIYLRGEGPLALLPDLGMLVLFGVILMLFALSRIQARE